MGGGKRRALKKLLKGQQNSAAPSPYDTPISSEPLDVDAILAGDDASSAPSSPERSKTVAPIPIPPPPDMSASAAAPKAGSNPSPVPSQASAPAALGGGGMYGNGSPLFGGAGHGGRSGKKSSKQRFQERQTLALLWRTFSLLFFPLFIAAAVGEHLRRRPTQLEGPLRRQEDTGEVLPSQLPADPQARKQQAVLDSAPPADPNWNAQLEAERQEEIRVISNACGILGRSIYEVQPDGHCMYAAVADQLGQLGILPDEQANNPYHTRRVAAKYMRDHQDDFLPFLASVDGEDMPGATDDGLMTPAQFKEYCHRVESTAEWGGEPEIQALSRAFDIPIHVIQCGPPVVVSHGGQNDTFGGATTPEQSAALGNAVVRISYHRRMYGLGEHYNSLRIAPA